MRRTLNNDFFVVSYSTSTSNHNDDKQVNKLYKLCLILLLHQTTTCTQVHKHTSTLCLILLLHQTTTSACSIIARTSCVLFYFYIKPQRLQTSCWKIGCCVLFYFYIKPQLSYRWNKPFWSCVLFYFYIKPQRSGSTPDNPQSCVLFYFYIKPQRLGFRLMISKKLHRFCGEQNGS